MDRLSAVIRRNDILADQPGFQLANFLRRYADPDVVFHLARERAVKLAATLQGDAETMEVMTNALMAMWLDGLSLGFVSVPRLPTAGKRRRK